MAYPARRWARASPPPACAEVVIGGGQERREPEVFVSKAVLPDPRDAVRSGQ